MLICFNSVVHIICVKHFENLGMCFDFFLLIFLLCIQFLLFSLPFYGNNKYWRGFHINRNDDRTLGLVLL